MSKVITADTNEAVPPPQHCVAHLIFIDAYDTIRQEVGTLMGQAQWKRRGTGMVSNFPSSWTRRLETKQCNCCCLSFCSIYFGFVTGQARTFWTDPQMQCKNDQNSSNRTMSNSKNQIIFCAAKTKTKKQNEQWSYRVGGNCHLFPTEKTNI